MVIDDKAIAISALTDAVETIERVLGITPYGVYSDVRVRLDILESRINNPNVPTPTVTNPFYIDGYGGVSISVGDGYPSESRNNGSLYLRRDGYTYEGVYAMRNGSWTLLPTDSWLAGGASLPITAGSIDIDGYLAIGTNPAQSGIIRIPNSEIIKGRDTSNSVDVDLIQIDLSNRLQLGSATTSAYVASDLIIEDSISHGTSLHATSGFIRLQNNDAISSCDAVGSGEFNLIKTSGNTIYIGDLQSVGISYDTGTGNTHAFYVNNILQSEFGESFIRFNKDVYSPTIYQDIQTIGNGQPLLIQAQCSVDGSSIGGNLILSSGTGTYLQGSIDLQIGGVNSAQLGADSSLYFSLGINSVANSGLIRIPNNTTIKARDVADSSDIYIIGTNTFDQLQLGSTIFNTRLDGYNVYINSTQDIVFNSDATSNRIILDGYSNNLYVILTDSYACLKAISGTGTYIDLPGTSINSYDNFAIDGYHVESTVTAANLNTLTNGSNADALHTHFGTIIIPVNSGAYVAIDGNYDGYLMPDFTLNDSELPIYLVNCSGTLQDFRINLDTAPGSGENIVFMVRKNNIDTGITITINDINTSGCDVVNNVAVVPGDLISIRVITSNNAAPANVISVLNIVIL